MLDLTNENKNIVTFHLALKQGVDPRLMDIKDLTFEDVILPDGTKLQDATFAEFQNTAWTLEQKNNVTLTDEEKT